MNVFKRFYDTEISVYNESADSYEGSGEDILLGKVICDLQPYDGNTDSNIYGLSENKAYKIYCDKNPLIANGRRVNFGGTWFRIVCAEEWKLGISALIQEA